VSRIVGKKLRETREAKNLSLEKITNETHIRLRYLEAIESGNFSALPSELQVKGFIRTYAGYLGLNADSLIDVFELDPWKAMETLEDQKPVEEPENEIQDLDSESSFKKIGETLKSQRETLELTIDDVAQYTHLRIPYLKALEAGEIDSLPSPVQGRGMLNNYAGFLGLDTDQILLQFADGLQSRFAEKTPPTKTPPSRSHPKPHRVERKLLSRDLVIGIILALSLVVFIVWGTIQVTAIRSEEIIEPTAPSIADVLLPSATSTLNPTSTPTVVSPVSEKNQSGESPEEAVIEETQDVVFISDVSEGPIQVQIVAKQRAWMRIAVDGNVEYDGRIIPGTIYGFAGEEFIEITTGNGSALKVLYNDQDIGTLGDLGEVVHFVITINGVQTPTPTITPSPTETVTGTPEISLTPTP